MSRPGGLSAEDKAALLEAQKAKETEKQEVYTPPHAEGSDETRKTPKVYEGPPVKISPTVVGETKTPTTTEVYRVGGTKPAFKETIEKLQDVSMSFYEKSGLPDKPLTELKEELTEINVSKPGSRLGPSPYRVKNTEQALNRLGWAATELTIGVAIEEGFPFSLVNIPPPNKSSDRGLRVLGGLMTPSPVDLVASQIISKLAKSKAWKKITGKYGEVDIDELEKEALRQWEKIKAPGKKYSTAELRAGVNRVYRNIEEIAEFYRKHPELASPDRSAAGAAQVPDLVLDYWDYVDDLGWEPDLYNEFMVEQAVDVPVGVLINILSGTMDRGEPVKETVIQIDDYVERLREGKVRPRLVSETRARLEEEALAKTRVEEELKEVPIVVPKEVQTTRAKTATIQEPVSVTETVTAEEEVIPETPTTPVTPITPKMRREMRDTRLKLWNGPKEKYRVKFTYPRGKSQTVTVEARSYPEAINRAQRIRRSQRYPPSIVDAVRIQ